MKIGIIGAGMVARAVAVQAIGQGHQVMLSNSRGPKSLFTMKGALGCETGTVAEAAAFGDIVIVAVPLSAYAVVPAAEAAGKIVIDTNNYYPMRDGQIAALDSKEMTTSELLAQHLPEARIVKAFNAIIATELERGGAAVSGGGRRALPIAGDDTAAKQVVTALQTSFGFDTLDAGTLADSWRFEEGTPAYCVPMDVAGLSAVLAKTKR